MTIYFIEACGIDAVKIGFSDSALNRRMADLQVGCPVELVLWASMPGGLRVEAGLHAKFRPHNLRGEWFRLSAIQHDVMLLMAGVVEAPRKQPHLGRRKWVDHDYERARQSLLGGASIREAATGAGIPRGTLYEWITQLPDVERAQLDEARGPRRGGTTRPRGSTAFDREDLVAGFTEGLSVAELADELEVSGANLYKWMKVWGIPTPQSRISERDG